MKCLSDFNRHPELNEAMPRTEPPEKMARYFEPQQSNQGEKMYSPNLDYDIDAMLEELRSLKRDLVLEGKVGKVEEIRKALRKAIETGKNTAKQRNHLKKVKRKQKSKIK